MTPLEHVVKQMVDADLPPLPAGHPKSDGKIHRFGPEKKGWYVLHEVTLKSGKVAVWGAFGYHQGENRNTVKVRAEGEGWSDQDKAEYIRKQREQEAKEQAARDNEIMLAANRAKVQWSGAGSDGVDLHPYLVKKAVPGYGLRVGADGQLYVPVLAGGGLGNIKGLQKIDAKGEKLYNKGIDKIGGCYPLCAIPQDAPVIGVGEGYATCATAHRFSGRPVVAAFDAGNIIHVARDLRAAYPQAHLLFLADDDYLLTQRLIDTLAKDYKLPYLAHDHAVSCGYTLVIDGTSRQLAATDGDQVNLTAWWRTDAQGIAYIEADIRKGRSSKHFTFKNAGVSSCKAAAAEVGNASVAIPVFASRNGEKWTDFNDLQIEQSIDATASQIKYAFDLALGVADSPAPSRASDSAPDFSPDAAPAPPTGEEERLGSAAGAPQDDSSAVATAEEKPASDSSHAGADVLAESSGLRPLQWALDHCAQIHGSTDVWDSLNSIRFKRSAFILMVGKATAKAWDEHAERRLITLSNVVPLDKARKGKNDAPAASGGGDGTGASGKKKRKEVGDEFWAKVNRLHESFVLIYGSDEVWDGEGRMLVKINPLRLAFGTDAVKLWLNNEERKMVPMDCVVFDPTMKSDPASTVNLFNGFGMEPKAGDCNLILELLYHLCGEDNDVYGWVLCWLAYPLQNPGAKMDTSIVMHGDEGSGKNLFFERCIARIYGEYAGVIGNAELEDKFNDWASRKLFVVCDEVVTRSELRQLKGKLKHMVSGTTIRINPKGMSSRDEANHINFIFLSNELQPLALDKTDRRNMVIWTPAKREEEFYKAVAAQIYSGGTEAFYQFLLGLDLGEFDEHTKPIMNKAKENLISLGLSPTERFYREWSGGFLPLPYVCCSAMQLYQAFCRWSYLNGERYPASQTMFGRTVDRIAFGQMSRGQVKYDLMSEVKQRTVYLVGDQPEDKDRHKWVEDGSVIFENALRKYRHVFDREDSSDG